MDIVNEGIALGVDLLILGFCVKEYVYYKQNVKHLKTAPLLTLNKDLKSYVADQNENRVPYAVIRGTVTPIGAPLRSMLSPAVTGVLQVMKIREHRVARGFAGFWAEQQNVIHVSSNETPFKLQGNEVSVEIINPTSANVIDLDVVYDNYEPTSPSCIENIFGFFTGIRQKGLQTTEEVLREGSVITAIGELELEGDSLRMQSSPVGPLFLTTSTKASLIRKFEESKNSSLVRIIICGAVATVLIGFILRKFYLRKKKEREERRMKETLDKERRSRRARTRPANLTKEQVCVVCTTNPKEIIILPCGHVCLCEDCAQKIQATCPICRGNIVKMAAAFIT